MKQIKTMFTIWGWDQEWEGYSDFIMAFNKEKEAVDFARDCWVDSEKSRAYRVYAERTITVDGKRIGGVNGTCIKEYRRKMQGA